MTRGHSEPPSSALFAVVPAAGHSRRMGRPKLLLPWGPHTVIEQVLTVLATTCNAIAVVIRPDDTALAERIGQWHRHTAPSPLVREDRGEGAASPSPLVGKGRGGRASAEESPKRSKTSSNSDCALHLVIPPTPPPDMRASVQHALNHVASHCHPSDRDAWLLVPADQPTLRPEWISALADARSGAPDGILVPTHSGRRGHPVLFPWPLAAEVPRLPADTGVNQLLRTFAARVREIPVPDPAVLTDLDTPDDYRRLRNP